MKPPVSHHKLHMSMYNYTLKFLFLFFSSLYDLV
jgi:hypothetical protein